MVIDKYLLETGRSNKYGLLQISFLFIATISFLLFSADLKAFSSGSTECVIAKSRDGSTIVRVRNVRESFWIQSERYKYNHLINTWGREKQPNTPIKITS